MIGTSAKIKFRYLTLVLILASILVFTGLSYALLRNTRHNLSASGLGKVKAVSESMMCEFCHLPHNANPAVPLWNSQTSDAAYTMYKSEYLQRAGYEAPTALGKFPDVGYRSRFCLSCHDGTVAIGGTYVLKGTKLAAPKKILGAGAEGRLPASSGSYLGVDLSNDHPVGIKYDAGISIHFGKGIRSMELKMPAPSADLKPQKGVKLYPPQSGSIQGYVECTSCHDPHTENKKFIVLSAANHATAVNRLCDQCHAKTEWNGSAHQASARVYKDPGVVKDYGANMVNNLLCMNCHKSHNGFGRPYLLRKVEENTCFDGAAGSSNTAPCHGNGAGVSGGKEIENLIKRAYGHPATTVAGAHTDLDVLSPLYLDWNTKRHAECVDCHNPHKAGIGSHSSANQWYPNVVTAVTNNVSNALKGVTGVEPSSWGSLWSVPTAFLTIESASKEYQICFKCHSYYSLQDADGISVFITASGATITDQSKEFNVNNKSAHPAVKSLNDQSGSRFPKALTPSQLTAPWTTAGNQTMYCSDCHGADNEAATDPKGPHGSSYKYMLKGRGKHWPANAGGTLWKWSNKNTDLFCMNCHPLAGRGNDTFTLHNSRGHDVPCVNCHVVIPHGSKRSRLIGYASDTQPYNYGGNSLKVTGFRKAQGPFAYLKSDCSTAAGCHGTPGIGMGFEP